MVGRVTSGKKQSGRLPWWLYSWVRGILVAPLVLGWLWLGEPPIGLRGKLGLSLGVIAWIGLMVFVRLRTQRKLDERERSAAGKPG